MKKYFINIAGRDYEVFDWHAKELVGVIRFGEQDWVLHVDRDHSKEFSETDLRQFAIMLDTLNKGRPLKIGPFVIQEYQ